MLEIYLDYIILNLFYCLPNNIWVRIMVLTATFSYIVAVSFIAGGNRCTWRNPPTCRKSLTHFITYCCIGKLRLSGIRSHSIVVVGTGCISSYKPNYHTTTKAHYYIWMLCQLTTRYSAKPLIWLKYNKCFVNLQNILDIISFHLRMLSHILNYCILENT